MFISAVRLEILTWWSKAIESLLKTASSAIRGNGTFDIYLLDIFSSDVAIWFQSEKYEFLGLFYFL